LFQNANSGRQSKIAAQTPVPKMPPPNPALLSPMPSAPGTGTIRLPMQHPVNPKSGLTQAIVSGGQLVAVSFINFF